MRIAASIHTSKRRTRSKQIGGEDEQVLLGVCGQDPHPRQRFVFALERERQCVSPPRSTLRSAEPDQSRSEEKMSKFSWEFVDKILTHGNDLCLLLNASVNAYRRLDPHFEAPNQIKADRRRR